ncbi:hypothetical protein DFH06DRAFT_1420095 [Mycena polygramma]|nr:hypothetical protein DFH06DRAFT_1420095 [Mycena polygramma]
MARSVDTESSQNDSDSDSESNVTEGLGDAHLPITVHEFVLETTEALSDLISDFPHIPHEQQRSWDSAVLKLTDSTVPSYKYALIGKTGAGKSTLINCLLNGSILPTSAAEIKRLLHDVRDEDEDDSRESPATRAKNKLGMVYPDLRNKGFESVTASALLKADPVRNLLGRSIQIPPTDREDFRDKVKQYLSHNATLWPIVQRSIFPWSRVRGNFPVLSTGIILIDLPGHGDDDDVRNNFAAEYLKEADGFILVTDVKRAQDDRDTLDFLRKMLNQFIIDGRSVDDCIALAATCTEASIGEGEVTVEGDDLKHWDHLGRELAKLRSSLRDLKKSSSRNDQRGEGQRDLEGKIRELEGEKKLLLATIRIAEVKESLQEVFQRVHCDLTPEENGTPHLPIFCVAGQDYLRLTHHDSQTPSVFLETTPTEIPSLRTHLRTAGERRRLRWATNLVDRASILSESVHFYFSERTHPGPLPPANKQKALDAVNTLELWYLDKTAVLIDNIQDELQAVEQELDQAVDKAIERAPRIMEKFGASGRMAWNTYRACMKGDGVYLPYDLNRELTQTILPDVQMIWNTKLNHRIPLLLKDAMRNMGKWVLKVIDTIVKALLRGHGTVFHQAITTARRSLPVGIIFGDLLEKSVESLTITQRDGTRSFNKTVQEQLTPQYQLAAQEMGRGTWARMKAKNQRFIEENAEDVFGAINIHIGEQFHEAVETIEENIRSELEELTTLLRVSLIEEIDLSEDPEDVKENILQMTMGNQPRFAAKKLDLEDRRRSLEM